MFEWIVEKSVEINISREALWKLLEDSKTRTMLLNPEKYESVELDGPFQAHTKGVARIKKSKNIPFTILEVKEFSGYSIQYHFSFPKTVIGEMRIEPMGENRVKFCVRQTMKDVLMPLIKVVFGHAFQKHLTNEIDWIKNKVESLRNLSSSTIEKEASNTRQKG